MLRRSRLVDMNTSTAQLQVLVIGSGFAGATLAVRLNGRGRSRVAVTVVNPRLTFVNRLRMHQVATGQVVPAQSLQRLLGPGIRLIQGSVTDLDPSTGWATVDTAQGPERLHFDRVVFASGSRTQTPELPGAHLLYGVGDVDQAHRLRAALRRLPEGRRVSVIGSGFTGLETVTEIAEQRPDLQLSLISGTAAGAWFSAPAAHRVDSALSELRIAEHRARVVGIDPGQLALANGQHLDSDLSIWCGGFSAYPLAAHSGLAVDDRGAVLTDPTLRSISHERVLAVGDAGHTVRPDGERYSMSCQFAFPSAAYAADLLRAEALDLDVTGYRDFSLGFLARCLSLGRRRAVLQRTNGADQASGWALTGRTAVAAKRLQVSALLANISTERRFPGTMRWPAAPMGLDRSGHPVRD